ncbi:MAG: DEAD/DEAH box helicase [Bacteroidales bacterium]|jgi:SNF2 family DNA or RNA helicase|nr:DEAD/DEAH box helicase [Bacteroidales bacterium]
MAEKFGKTWWGERWLGSLRSVDYDNRLPRGASYARGGRVKSVKIRDNKIVAKVAGSRLTPYTVTIVVPTFSESSKESLLDKIIEHPALISKLLNRELDPAILNISESLGLKVFPQRWTDFEMKCSCPDWAVPCKHLAAVIYMLSREIDNNPFFVFDIHNVHLIEELKKRNIFLADQNKTEIPTLESLIKPPRNISYSEDTAYQKVDFSQLKNVFDALVQLLPDAPPFYPSGNFREKYASKMRRIAQECSSILSNKLNLDTIYPLTDKQFLTNRSTLSLTLHKDNRLSINEEYTLDELIPALFALNPDYLLDMDASVAALHKILFASLHLLANGMVIPQIVQLENKRFIIRWLPASMDQHVKTVVEKLSKIVSDNLATEILSLFISNIIAHLSKLSKNDDLFEKLFFKGISYDFAGVGENALSGGIKVWLDRYYLTTELYKPVIIVSEPSDRQDKQDKQDKQGKQDNQDGQFEVQISVESANQPPVPLKDIWEQKKYEKQRFKILQSVSLLTPFIKGLDTYINLLGNTSVRFSNKEFASFLMEVLPAIRLLDIKILLPKSLQELLRPKVSVKLKKSSDSQGFLRLDDLLSFEWQIALGNKVISLADFQKLMKNASRLFKFKENYIYVSDTDIEKLNKAITGGKLLNSYQLLQTALAEEYDGAPVALTNEVRDLIRELTSEEDIPLPKGLNVELRPYQQRGFSWMYRNSRIGFGSVIADDMGLGKTLQVISILLKLKEENAIDKKHKALVVVPTGLLINWKAEIEKFAPSLSTHIFHGATRDLKQFDADILLTTYGVLRSDFEVLKKQKWQVMVIDEAQNIKNHTTAQSKAVKSVPANIRIAMSGTPVENRLTEFWSIMDYTNKGYLGNIKTFKESYAEPIQISNDEHIALKFRKITAPFMMRRMKSDKTVISDLPDKIEQIQFASLGKQQVALYQKTMEKAMEQIEGCAGSDSQTLFKRQGLVLQMILALKQICNHPTQFLKDGQFEASLSGKTELLLELLDSINESGEKVLIFTQFTEMGGLLQRFIAERFGEEPMFYHGGCSVKQREEMVSRFQNGRADKIFILSLKAGGTGLNLTAASHVIHYDLWWNPAVESQATDRAYRIGQKKNVMVHRMICKNTFEERIDDMIQKKKHLAEMTVANGEKWIGKLSNKELREIFG